MKQAKAQALREMSVAEVISAAVHKRRKALAQGRTSRRVVLFLPPYLLPPPSGEYESFMGVVRISSIFRPTEGRWIVTVLLPEDGGFKLRDHLSSNNPPSSDTPPAK